MSEVATIQFVKIVGGVAIRCEVCQTSDGGVLVSGDEIDTWIFEFCENALERAVQKVEEEGYVRATPL